MTRRQIAWGIVALWAASFGWLLWREYLRPHRAALAEGALLVSPSAQYFRLRAGERQVGFASTTIDTLPGEIRVENVTVTEQPVGGALRHVESRQFAQLSRLLQLRSFSARLRTDDGFATVLGEVDGDTVLRLAITEGESLRRIRLPLTRPLLLAPLLPLRLVFGHELAIGKRYDLQVFDPVRLEMRDMTLSVAAESTILVADSARRDSAAHRWVPARTDTVRVWRVGMASGASRGLLWLDELGQVVRAEMPDGFALERMAFELAFENFRKRDTASELAERPAIVPATLAEMKVPERRRHALRSLAVRWQGPVPADLAVQRGGQEMHGDTVRVQQIGAGGLAADYRLPADRAAAGDDLSSSLLIQSQDSLIRYIATREVAGATDPARAAAVLAHEVFARTTRAPQSGPPDARHVAETRRGDCNHLAELYVALARAAGLPARTVSGLLYVDGRFYLHAWAEVKLNDWVPVDPSLGQFPADAAHLRLATGRLARPLELTPLLGGVTLTVVGAETER